MEMLYFSIQRLLQVRCGGWAVIASPRLQSIQPADRYALGSQSFLYNRWCELCMTLGIAKI